MTDDRRMTTDRFFGRVDERLGNLQSMLEYVDTTEPTESELRDWLVTHTAAESDSTIEKYVGFQRSIDLLTQQSDRYATTPRGTEFAEAGDPELVARALLENVKGFETILQAIENGDRTREEIQAQLREQYPEYRLPLSIVGRHLEWLRAIDAVELREERFLLQPLGHRLTDELEDRRWITPERGRPTESDSRANRSRTEDLQTLREEAQAAATETPSQSTTEREVTEYNRSNEVREYVLERANGYCEGCREPAPFLDQSGAPYLHAHHIHELADGGSDSPDRVIALCPNCHYRVHHGADGDTYNRELENRLSMIEEEFQDACDRPSTTQD